MLQYIRSYEAMKCGLPTLLRNIVLLRCYFTVTLTFNVISLCLDSGLMDLVYTYT